MGRGGLRRGRAYDPDLIREIHCRVEHRSHAVLAALASLDRTSLGEAVDKVVKVYVRSQRANIDGSQSKHKDCSSHLQEAA